MLIIFYAPVVEVSRRVSLFFGRLGRAVQGGGGDVARGLQPIKY